MKLHIVRCKNISFVFLFTLIRLCFVNLNKVIEVDGQGQIKSKPVLKKVVDLDEGALQHFKKFGKFGHNYFIGVDTKDEAKTFLPYINCQKYNKANCKAGEECKKTVKCVLNDPFRGSERLACMANFVLEPLLNTTFSEGDLVEPSLTDCWPQAESQLAECKEQDECVADIRRTGKSDRPSLFCCCRTHNCNQRMVYSEKEMLVPTPPTSTPVIVDALLFDFSNWLHYLKLIVILISILLFASIFGVFLFYMPKLRKKLYKRSGVATKSFLPFYRRTNDQKEETNDRRGETNDRKGKTNDRRGETNDRRGGTNDRREQLETLLDDWNSKNFDHKITLEDGQRVHKNNIKLDEMVSIGRFGQVYKAFVVGPNCLAAVKIVPDSSVSSWKNEMAMYSIRALRANKHIAEFYGGFPSETDFWLVFNFYENNSLSDFLRMNTLSIMHSLTIISSLLDGISFLHEERMDGPNQKPAIVHRDIKSKNILVTAGMDIRIADFGLALRCDPHCVRANKIQARVGTVRYMSPEILEGATAFTCLAFQQIDVYATALVVWEVLSRTETEGDVEQYALPYEREVGQNPTFDQMKDVVLYKRFRPTTRESLSRNKNLKIIVDTMREMWEFEPDSRISCSRASIRLRDRVNI